MKKYTKNLNLTEGKIWKVLLRFILPIFLGTLFQYCGDYYIVNSELYK
ncbi:hypothetical protein [Fusobacterium polymorphum]